MTDKRDQAVDVFREFLRGDRLLVCGDRNWVDVDIIRNTMAAWCRARAGTLRLDGVVVIHGCARGVDTIASTIAAMLGAELLPFAANWTRYGRAAGPIRNQQMIDEGLPNWVMAFHPDIDKSKGTADMVRRAVKANILCQIVDNKGYSTYR